MAEKKSIFNFGTLFGDADLQNLMQRVDDLNYSLDKKINKDPDNSQFADQTLKDMIKLISSEEEIPRSVDDTPQDGIQHLLKDLVVPIQRQNRYRVYDEIYSSVQIIKRIVRVYTNNILQRDIISGKALTILEVSKTKSNSNKVIDIKDFTQQVINHFQLEYHLSNKIIQYLLRYGDAYLELIDLKKDIFNLPNSKTGNSKPDMEPAMSTVLTESEHLQSRTTSSNILNNLDYLKNRILTNGSNSKYLLEDEIIDNFLDYYIEFEDNSIPEEIIFEDTENNTFINKLLSKEDKEFVDTSSVQLNQFKAIMLNRFLLRIHSPKKIVNLTTIHNNVVLGYVEVRERESIEKVPGVGLQFATILKQISTVNKDKTEDISGTTRKIVNRLIKKIINKSGVTKKYSKNKNLKQINSEFEKQLHSKIGDDLFYMVKKLFNESDQEGGPKDFKMAVRYIPSDNMIHLCLNPIEFAPYGTSVIDPVIYPAKLYLLTQLTNMVIKLSRASLIRKWTIETGPREHGTNLMQKLKREIRNQRITVDDIVSFKSIPKILSDFKDMMVLTKKGTRFVDVEVQSMGDPNLKTADLEDTRREILALSGIPAPYLGYNDVVDLREQLVNINITFATEIIAIQSLINDGLTKFIDKIADRLGFDDVPSQSITVALKPPVILLLQMLEATMSSIGNIQMSLQSVNVEFNPYYLLKKFIPNIDWDEFSAEAKQYGLQKAALAPPNQDGGM